MTVLEENKKIRLSEIPAKRVSIQSSAKKLTPKKQHKAKSTRDNQANFKSYLKFL